MLPPSIEIYLGLFYFEGEIVAEFVVKVLAAAGAWDALL
jgi:hypothetical protein